VYSYVWQMVFAFLLSGLLASLQACQQTICVCVAHIHLLPPDDGLQTGLKHVEAWLFNKMRTNGALCWFIVQILV
jgi:hypothetical protein